MIVVSVVIPFVNVDAKQNPNLRTQNSAKSRDAYLRASIVCLASFRRWNEDVNLVFATNAPVPEWFEERTRSLRAEVRYVEFSHVPPRNFSSAFLGSFFLIDVLQAPWDSDHLVLTDPDVICLGNLEPVLEDCEHRIGALPLNYARDRPVNGLSSIGAESIHQDLGLPPGPVTHFGGEFYVIPQILLSEAAAKVEAAWRHSLAQFLNGERHFPTEEHMMNYVLRQVPTTGLQEHVKRVWTAHGFRNVDGKEADLLIWHLPAEKERGFRKVWAASSPPSWFWEADQDTFIKRSSRAFGVGRRGPIRWTLDNVARSYRALRSGLDAVRTKGT